MLTAILCILQKLKDSVFEGIFSFSLNNSARLKILEYWIEIVNFYPLSSTILYYLFLLCYITFVAND